MSKKAWAMLALCMAVSTVAGAGTAYWSPLPGSTVGPSDLTGGPLVTTDTVVPDLPVPGRAVSAASADLGAEITWTPTGNGTWDVYSNCGRIKGTLTNDAGNWVEIPKTADYTMYASWDVPTTTEIAPYDNPVGVANSRMYFGPYMGGKQDFNAGTGTWQLNYGLEWNATADRWELNADDGTILKKAIDLSATPFSHIELFFTFTSPGTYKIEYALDYGAKQLAPMATNPLTGTAHSNPVDLVAFWGMAHAINPAYPLFPDSSVPDVPMTSYRGDAARNFMAYATSASVADINGGGQGDADGDTTVDIEDAYPTNPDYATNDDHDGLPDEWENTYWPGDLTQTPADDPDGDTYTNEQEFEAGTDPTDPDSNPYVGMPAAGLAALALLASTLIAGGTVALRRRS